MSGNRRRIQVSPPQELSLRTHTAIIAWLTLSASLFGAARSTDAASGDPASRGMDLFVHAPSEVISGGRLFLQVRVWGFPTVSTLAPLAGARVVAAWDPESLGPRVAAAPPPVVITADASGLAQLDVPVPRGAGELKLLVSARSGQHERTRTIAIARRKAYEIDLRVSDTAVVPGRSLAAWLFVRDGVSGQPVAGAAVDVALMEGRQARFSRRLITDRGGGAVTQVPVPLADDPDWRWTLTARTAFGGDDEAEASRELKVREETPGAPAISLRWSQPSVRPGARASFQIRLRDGAGGALASQPVRYWVGPRGTEPPADEAGWQRASTVVVTDAAGEAAVTVDTPAIISPRGTSLTVVAKAAVEGHPLSGRETLALEAPRLALELIPEYGVLLPGHAQRLFVHAHLGDAPISCALIVEGHGLAARLQTDRRGWGELLWNVPLDAGATVPATASTDCAGSVAATVRVRPVSPMTGLDGQPPVFSRCVRIDRDATAAIRPDRPLVRAGDSVGTRMVGARSAATSGAKSDTKSGAATSVILQSPDGAAVGAWLTDAARGAEIRLPPYGQGVWTLSAAGTTRQGAGATLPASVLVVPRVLPRLVAARVGGDRSVRGGVVELDADLSDGHGHALTGTVGAVVIDQQGGAHPQSLLALDTRQALTAPFGVGAADADDFLEGDRRFDGERWAALARTDPRALVPLLDPATTLGAELDKAFGQIVRSLEGAVFQSSGEPERLRDVRVRAAGGFALNPEMLALTTEAMETPPTTPGGEPWRLSDLMAIDAQVNYDNVARRVTRLKLFRVLSAVRTFVYESSLGPDEPLLRDPNALLRRLVRDDVIAAADLLDPWAHGLAFVRARGPRVPFLSLVPGYALQSAGPDGRFGTADDVRDPFQRVLASKSPYAKAVKEDRIVDSRWDMRVGDDTVDAWKATLEELTGTTFGGSDSAYGTGGLGSAGGGEGFGGGAGGLAGKHQSRAIELGPAVWLPPVRTDEAGHLRLKVPLGDGETTWQIVLVAVPDQGSPAVTSVEVPVSTPLSLAVNTGASWMVGDQVGVTLTLHNRTDRPLAGALRVTVSGAAALVEPRRAGRAITLPARSATPVVIYVRAAAAGAAILEAAVAAPGVPGDAVRHEWPIRPAGETALQSDAAWIEREAVLTFAARADGAAPAGPGRLVLERGLAPALSAALDSLRPERLTGLRAVADALEVLGRVRSWAIVRGGETDPLAVRARELAGLAAGRTEIYSKTGRGADHERPWLARAQLWAPASALSRPAHGEPPRGECPPSSVPDLTSKLDWLEVAPRAEQGAERACWTAFVTSALQQLAATNDPLLLADAVLAVGDRPASAIVAGALVDRLRAAAPVRPDGTLVLPAAEAGSRAARSMVMAALVRGRQLGNADGATAASAAKLGARLYAERDPEGGYGSIQATRAAVRALLEAEAGSGGAPPGHVTVRWTEVSSDGRAGRTGSLDLAPSSTASVVLPAAASASAPAGGLRVQTSSPGVVARLERPVLLSFRRPSDPAASRLSLEIVAPTAVVVGATAVLQVSLRHTLGRAVPVVVRVPLPPGATLAEPVDGVRQIQGALYVRTSLDSDPLPRVFAIPLRFSLPGTVTLPETTARIDDEDLPSARAPARPLVVRPRT
jgi:hypothetical protein